MTRAADGHLPPPDAAQREARGWLVHNERMGEYQITPAGHDQLDAWRDMEDHA